MDTIRKNLLTFGFVRSYCKDHGIPFLPEDIVGLFIAWFMLNDHFDKNRCHPAIALETDDEYEILKIKDVDTSKAFIYSAVGSSIVKKGQKQTWKFAVYKAEFQIGIIDEEILKSSNEYVTDFTDTEWKGWGLYVYAMTKYHSSETNEGSFTYGEQYKLSQTESTSITMILDLTQATNKNGVLSFEIEGEKHLDIPNATKILYDDLDINKQYRMATAIQVGEHLELKMSLNH